MLRQKNETKQKQMKATAFCMLRKKKEEASATVKVSIRTVADSPRSSVKLTS